MANVRFLGRVHPEALKLTMSNMPTITFEEPPYPPHLPHGLKISYAISVKDAQVVMDCEIEPWNDAMLGWVINRVSTVIRSMVDLCSFGTGVPYVVSMDAAIYPDGSRRDITIRTPPVEGICTFMQTTGNQIAFSDALPLLFNKPDLALCLRDLINGATYPDSCVVDCARAIEGIRHLIDPNGNKRGEGWGKLQDVLNVDRSYREFITGTSSNPRHGDKTHISGDVLSKILKQSWTIMNRYIEYLMRGEKQLPFSEFRLLK
jgi:hypothetical protein